MEALLGQKAQATIVGGLFGTALKAALVASPKSGAALVLLQKAIRRDVGSADQNANRIGWKSAVDQLDKLSPWMLCSYKELFPMPSSTSKGFQMPHEAKLTPKQRLLAGVLVNWDLPGADELNWYRDEFHELYPYYGTVQDQLDDIQRALMLSEPRSHEHELNDQDFRFKALFWSGVNHILEMLRYLMEDVVETVQRTVERTDGLKHHAYHASRRRRTRQRHDPRLELLNRIVASEGFGDSNMDFYDKLTLHITQQQQLLSHKQDSHNAQKTYGMTKLVRLVGGGIHEPETRRDGEKTDRDIGGNMELYLVLNSLLPLLNAIVEAGNECDRFHGTVAQRDPTNHVSDLGVKVNQDLIFELLAAVA